MASDLTGEEQRHERLARAIYDEWRRDLPGEPSWSRLREREQDRWLAIAEAARTVWAVECDGRAQSFLDAVNRIWRSRRDLGEYTKNRRVAA